MKKDISDKVSMIASWFSVSVGIGVLIGWSFDIGFLKSVTPNLAGMRANTAACFILAGIALWLLRHEKPYQWKISLARFLSWSVVVIACLTLAEYLFGVDFKIDQALFSVPITPGSMEPPGRMAHATAFSFIMLGLSLLLSHRNLKMDAIVQLPAVLSGLTALLSLIGYLFGAKPLYTSGFNTRMALHSAVTFIVSSAGVLSLSSGSGLIAILTANRIGSSVARRLLPVAIGLTIIIGWLHMKGEHMNFFGYDIGIAIHVSAMILAFTALIVWTASSMNKAEAEHVEAELQYNTILATAIDGFWIADTNGQILDVNEAYCRMTGYTREELLTMRVQDLEAVESPEEIARHIKQMIKDGRDRFETRHRRKDGAVIDIDAAVLFTNIRGGVFSVFIRDITGRKQEERAMQESRQQLLLAEARIRAVVETAVDGIITIDELGIIESFNLAAERIFGYSADEVTGRNVNILMPEQYAKKHDAYIKRYLSSCKKHIIGIGRDVIGRRKDGSLLSIHLSVSEVRLHGDRRIFTGLVRDLTEQKRSEELLRESEKKFRTIFDGASDGIFLVDLETRKFILCNTSCTKMLGYAKEEFICLDIADIHPAEDLLFIYEQIRKMASGEQSTPGEIRFIRKDGAIFFAAISATLIILGGKSSILVVFRDITERRQAEEIIHARLRLTEFSASHSLDELLQKTLDEIEKLTDSSIGFYHFVEPDEQTLSLQAWSTRTLQEFCTAEGNGLHYNIENAGVWVDCMHQRKAVIHNDYAALPHRKGTPQGHAPVTRELVTPIFRNDKIVAIMGVGNKPEDYTEQDVTLVTYFADIAWELTERKRTEIARQKAEELYRNLAESLPQLIWTCRADGPCDYLSPQWVTYTGIPEAEQLGYGWSKQLHPDDWPSVQTTWMESVKTGAPFDIEFRIRRADGAYRWFETRATPLRNREGEIVKWLGLNLDIDDVKQAEQKLQAALRDLRRSNEELEQFAKSPRMRL